MASLSTMLPDRRHSKDRLTEPVQAFENTSTNVAAAQMRNALTNLAETVEDPKDKKVFAAVQLPVEVRLRLYKETRLTATPIIAL
jgi:UTP--glucose-1-phosphate uridylyltransferase